MLGKLTPYILLLLGSLGLAYYSSLPGNDKKSTASQWLDIRGDQVATIKYQEAKTKSVTISPYQKSSYWVTVEEFKKPAKPLTKLASKPGDGHEHHSHGPEEAEAAPAADKVAKVDQPPPIASEPLGITEIKGFKANQNVTSLIDFFAPLYADRRLGNVSPENRDAYGLGTEAAKLTIEAKNGAKHEFLVGAKSYGTANKYLFDQQRQELLLIKSVDLDNLAQASSKLFENKLTDIAAADFEQIAVSRGTQKATWDHTSQDGKGRRVWKKNRNDTQPDKALESWVDKIAKLRAQKYATADEVKKLEDSPALFSLAVLVENKEKELFVFKRQEESVGASGQPAGATEYSYWVKTGFLGTYVRVSNNHLDAIDKDLPTLMSNS